MSTTIKKSIRSRLHPLYPYLYYTKKLTHDKPDQTYVGTILEFENSKYNNHPTISNKQYYVCLININTTTSYYHLPYTTRSQLRRRFTPPERVSADSSWNLDTFYRVWKRIEEQNGLSNSSYLTSPKPQFIT